MSAALLLPGQIRKYAYMRFVALSDHAGDMLADARRRRASAQRQAEERYRRELAAYRRRAGEARDRRGEIDYLLLGPGGMFAVEVKYVNGTFRITRDRWRYVKYDNYGNAVEQGAVQDRGGRPPNVQLTEPLAALEEFLAKRGRPVRMQPVVLLNHPKARIDQCAADVGVMVLTSTAELLRLVLAAKAAISGSQLAEVERLIERDHRFHATASRG